MILYHHLEISVRELDAKLWLAARAAATNAHESLICNVGSFQDLLKRSLLTPGVWMTKSLTPNKNRLALLQHLTSAGFLACSQDEEAQLLTDDYEAFALGRFSPETLAYVSCVFCWGGRDRDALASLFPGWAGLFMPVGSPRVDLWTQAMKSCWPLPDSLQPGRPFILIPLNLGFPVGLKDFSEIVEHDRVAGYFDRVPSHERDLYISSSENVLMLYEFVRLAIALADRFPNLDVVVRPHPAEVPSKVQKLLPRRPNLRVCREGSITGWVQHAAAVVHHGCTTALESVVSKTPLITYVPLDLPVSSRQFALANRLGFRCVTPSAVVDALNSILNGYSETESPRPPGDLVDRLGLDGPGFAADRILQVISGIDSNSLPDAGRWSRVRAYLALRQLSRSLPRRHQGRHRQSSKRPPFRQAQIRQRLATICQAMAMPIPRCEVLAPDVLLIRPAP